jgi:cytochrome c
MKQAARIALTALATLPALASSVHAEGDAALGADLFKQNCSACHSAEPGQNLVGPSLYSVVGRHAAAAADFSYSNAMKSSGIVWTQDQLMSYLKAPRRFIPGVKMMFPGLDNASDRANVIAYLSTLGNHAQAKAETPAAPSASAPRASN